MKIWNSSYTEAKPFSVRQWNLSADVSLLQAGWLFYAFTKHLNLSLSIFQQSSLLRYAGGRRDHVSLVSFGTSKYLRDVYFLNLRNFSVVLNDSPSIRRHGYFTFISKFCVWNELPTTLPVFYHPDFKCPLFHLSFETNKIIFNIL